MRLSVAVTVLCLSIVAISAAQNAGAAMTRRPTNIPAQPLGAALEALAKERDLQVIYRSDLVGGVQSAGAVGVFTPEQALGKLLAGTGLTYRYLNETTVTIAPASTSSPTAAPGPGSSTPPSSPDRNGDQKSGGSSLWDRFLVAQTAPGQTAGAPAVEKKNEQPSDKKPVQLEEVLVTAQKREERLIDTPQSVSVLSSDDLARLAATQFRDFATTVPGMGFTTAGPGYTQISLRGVTTGFDIGPTIGIYVDEVPYGSSTNFAAGAQRTLDVGLFDLDRIEVLRGPQGTLYGASTMGGLIKYVTIQPDATRFNGNVQAGLSDTGDGGGVSYNVAGTVNAPLMTDKVAVRASGFESRDGGYIDNVALARKNVNRSDTYGARLDLLVTPIEALSIRITGFLQNISRDGEATADYTSTGVPLYGKLDQYRKFAEPFDQHFRLASGTITYDLGSAMLTAISSYQSSRSENAWDASAVYVPLLKAFFARSYSAVADAANSSTNKFTQEVRLAGKTGRPLEWLVGGFYTDENSHYGEHFVLRDLAGAPAPNDLYSYSTPSSYKEYAAFGDLTWHVISNFDLTGGVRYAHNQQTYAQLDSSLFTVARPTSRSSEGVTTYLADARYHFTGDTTGYVRYATGYRPGGPNFAIRDAQGNLLGPDAFQADRLRSYEVGFKAETQDRRLGMDLAVYDIDWSNIQITVIRGGFGFIANAPSGATVQGSELTLTARPADRFTFTGAFAYQHAYLKEAAADLGAAVGERLPNVPRFTAAVNGDYQLWNGDLRPTIGATLRHVTDRTASFDNNTSFVQYHLPGYTTVDLRSGFLLSSVNLQLYVHNIFDERGQLSSTLPQFGDRIAILQPRTFGVTASTKF